MNIGLDIMGGDFVPVETVKGAILAQKELGKGNKLFLFGNHEEVATHLIKNNSNPDDFVIVDCENSILMEDYPVESFREKRKSEIVQGFTYLKKNLIDGFASAGNTGSMLVGATTVTGVIEGVLRPVISSCYPNNNGGNNLLLDVGLSADCKPENLHQFALIGSLYAKYIMEIKNPRVGLLNVGSEDSKGSTTVKSAYKLIAEDKNINFIGNIEGYHLHNNDMVDVIISDGFTGNIVLKHAESFYKILKQRNINDSYFNNYNYENYGGTPILGIQQPVVIGHGASSALAIKNMILLTKKIIESKLVEKISKSFSYVTN